MSQSPSFLDIGADSSPPLAGVRVLDLSRLLPGPFCTLILSDLGAAIDKLEDPHVGDYLRMFPPVYNGDPAVDGLSGRYVAVNRDKRSVCLDLKKPAGRAAFLRLLPRYDVVVESFRPGVMERLGLGYAELARQHPRLVLCSISGYGQDGPYKERAGHDLNYCALAGVLSLAGESPERPPHALPVQLADLAGGALWAATAINAALFAAARTGVGRHLDVSMTEGALSFLLPDYGNLDTGAADLQRGAELLTGGSACYGVYRTADGRYLSVAALEPKFWLAFNAVIGRRGDPAELVEGPEAQARIRGEIQAILQEHTRDEWERRFAAADACVEPVLTPREAQEHPLHRERRLFFQLPGGVGQVRTPLAARDAPAAPPPRLGQHSAAILSEAGFSEPEIAALRQAGVTV